MKKGKKIGLALNRKVISNLHSNSLTGGSNGWTTKGNSLRGGCGGGGASEVMTACDCPSVNFCN